MGKMEEGRGVLLYLLWSLSSFMLSEVTFQFVFCWTLRASNSYNLERKFRKQHIIHHLCAIIVEIYTFQVLLQRRC